MMLFFSLPNTNKWLERGTTIHFHPSSAPRPAIVHYVITIVVIVITRHIARTETLKSNHRNQLREREREDGTAACVRKSRAHRDRLPARR